MKWYCILDKSIFKTRDTLFLNARSSRKYQQYEDYWKEIYKWNKTLPSDQQIFVYGIRRYNWPIVAPLYFCIPNDKEVPSEINAEIVLIKNLFRSNSPPVYYDSDLGNKGNQKLRKGLRKNWKSILD